MKRLISLLCSVTLIASFCSVFCFAEEQAVIELDCPSAILIERSTGKVLYEKSPNEERPMASVTKIMTLLLIVEAIDDGKITLETEVACSEYAASMGGSQIYLKEGETLSVGDMLKAITVSSANDAAVSMAEHIAGSHDAFVNLMNQRAQQLGMKHTVFKNCTGLDADGHYSSARDIAVMSSELLKHDLIRNYTSIWMDTLRDGTFGLSNTNKLVRFYEGCTGLKTGSTSKALYCISASAERDGMELIAVVLASPTSQKRFEDAKKLLNYGFASFEIFSKEIELPTEIEVEGGKEKSVPIQSTRSVRFLTEKGMGSKIGIDISLEKKISAPADKDQKVGEINLVVGENIIENYPIVLAETIKKATFWDNFLRIMRVFLTV